MYAPATNVAETGRAVLAYVYNESTLTVKDNLFSGFYYDTNAKDGAAGAFWVYDKSAVVISGNTLTGNRNISTNSSGFFLNVENSALGYADIQVSDNLFENNTGYGALKINGKTGQNILMSGNTFRNCYELFPLF